MRFYCGGASLACWAARASPSNRGSRASSASISRTKIPGGKQIKPPSHSETNIGEEAQLSKLSCKATKLSFKSQDHHGIGRLHYKLTLTPTDAQTTQTDTWLTPSKPKSIFLAGKKVRSGVRWFRPNPVVKDATADDPYLLFLERKGKGVPLILSASVLSSLE